MKAQNMVGKIAFQGELGANSHIACLEACPDFEPLPCRTFEDAFQAVKDGSAKLAMIAIENTTAGRVADVHHLLPDSGLWIVGEHFLRIEFHLLAIPGVKVSELKEVHSHVHALGQCRKVIKKHKLTAIVAVAVARILPWVLRRLRDEHDLFLITSVGSGLLLALFMWGHMFFVSSILISKDAMWTITKMFEGYFIFGRSHPGIVSCVVAAIIALIVLHAMLAVRKFPISWRQYRLFRGHMKLIRHEDTTLWFWQVFTGFALFFLASVHLYIMLTRPDRIGPFESADRV